MSRLLKVLLFVVVAIAVVALLFTVVFPWVDRTLITDPTLEAARLRAGVPA
jgi:MFS-type transporter involved in bile tolerance (Atg22 family)